MKVVTVEQQQAYTDASVKGGLKGAGIAAGVALPGIFFLNRTSPFFRALTPPLKAFASVAIIVPSFIIGAERAGLAFDQANWTGVGKRELDLIAQREADRWEGMSLGSRVKDYAKRNKYGLIAGSWAVALGGSFAVVQRNKHQSFSQKLVQARVYAQAWTIVLLLAAAVASGVGDNDGVVTPHDNEQHSWQDILISEGYLKKGDEGRSDEDRSKQERSEQLKGAAKVAAPKKGGE